MSSASSTIRSGTWKRLDGIDLLRGLAIFFVLMNHVNIRLLGSKVLYTKFLPPQLVHLLVWNGQLGVQMFFAVSGFLIASITIRRWDSLSQVRLRGFYLFRFARIAPLMFLLLAVLSGLHFAHIHNYVVTAKTGGIGRALLAAFTFHVNELEIHRGYLPGNWDILWSLSVEEMFYLFFPLLCLLFAGNRLFGPGVELDCDLDSHGHPPMQSTFKFPLALVVLHEVELGRLQLDQPVRFLKSDRSATFSPLQKEFPDADVDVPLRKIIKLSVETSDNTATDIELRLIGGPGVLQQYLDSLGLSAIHQQDTEHTLHGDQKLQYRDYAEPSAIVALLRLFADHSPLNPEHTALLNEWMLEATSGPKRIRGLLPAGTPVADKTGSSGLEWGMIPATNDVGLITLPDGRRLALAVFVTNAHADQDACERVIASIAKEVYDEALTSNK